MPRGKSTNKKVKEKIASTFDFDYGGVLDIVEKKFKLTANMTDRFKYAVSSGLLVEDLILGGGLIVGGMYTEAGGEQTAKSTDIMNFLCTQIAQPPELRPKVVAYFDAEGSFDPVYFNNMLKSEVNASELFGVKDGKGNYVVKPRIRYYPENAGEKVLDSISAILKRLPDKELLADQWYYVFENTKENQKALKDKYDKNLFSKFNKFYIPTDDTAPQAIIVVDSWPSLVTERADDEDKSEGLGGTARMFAQYLPKVKGKLRRKGVILMGVNQLRERPMQQGDPRYEPCGMALRFQSDVRLWRTSRAIPHDKGMIEKEESVTGSGEDTYRYVHLKAVKNKLATPHLEGWVRIWVSDEDGQGRGFCPAWDVFEYLKMTGQAEGVKKKISIKMKNGFTIDRCSFLDLKGLILLKGKDLKEHCESLGIKNNPKIRETCFTQIKTGVGTTLYYENLKPEEVEEVELDDEDEDEEDDYDDAATEKVNNNKKKKKSKTPAATKSKPVKKGKKKK